ncbi:MAG: FAD-binding protein, partial [Clostridia bacterium]|nr:FAD-binding protein [Clostridia bacterium]
MSDPSLASALCGDARTVFDELQQLGLCFNRDGEQYQALRPLGASYPRVVSIGNETGAAALKKLRELLNGQVTELAGTRAVRLLTSGGRVCGALALDQRKKEWLTLPARAVILACGGFCGVYPMSTNKRGSGGDGVAMAYEVGAKLCDMEFIQFEPSGAVWPSSLVGTSMITTLFFEGAVLRNRSGERFMLRYGEDGERVGKDVLARRIAEEIAAGQGTEHGGVYFDATGVGAERLKRDYAMYVERYGRVGIDLSAQPIELAPMPHTSLGGVRIDADGRTTVEGLFACGEVTGGLHGANRIGGSAGLETFVFGRRAGRSAAQYAKNAPEITPKTETIAYGEASIASKLTALRET